MEARVEMLQEEDRVTHCDRSSHRAQDRSIRRLQWAVAGCVLCMCAVVFLTAYQMFGGLISYRKDKVQSEPSKRVGTGHYNFTRKPSAHLTGTKQSGSNVLQWEAQLGLAFTRDGMQYVNNSIQIPMNGYYFVYSKVSFSGCSKQKSTTQNILKSNNDYPAPDVLLSGISYCVKEHGQFYPIYLGALFELKIGDKLMVNVSNIKLVEPAEYKTFFGVFLMYDSYGLQL
ncbi:tumor necrosis factor ligand superfamily member 15 [Pseudophryne corroboree]|uniref:tumor necrosis factor ligand superfamily member 15 n=1 Tax=Pseudophryne corroboree TaxID=495146 RepID=UPI003081B46F